MSVFAVAMALAIIGSILGDTLVKQATRPMGGGSAPSRDRSSGRTRRSLFFAAGIALLTIHFAAFLKAMQLAPLTVVVPLMSCTYVGTTLLARIFLGEPISRLRIAGTAVIMAGVVLLGRTMGQG